MTTENVVSDKNWCNYNLGARSGIESMTRVCKALSLNPSTLRYYERMGLISSHRMGGRRYFDREQIERIRMVIALKKAGFGLSEISAGLLCSRGVSFDGVDVPRTIVWTKLENLRRKAGQIDAAIEAAKVLACKRNEVSESIKLLEEHLGDAVWSESGTRERVEVSRQQQ